MFKKLFGGGKKEEEPHNTLTVVVHEMHNMKRTKLLHDPNSFIQLRMIAKNGKKPLFKKVARTNTIMGNLHPRWNQTFTLPVGSPFDEILQIDLYDVGAVFGGEELVGNAFIPLESLTATPSVNALYPVQSLESRKELGRVHLTLSYEGFGAVPPPTAPPMAPPTAPPQPAAPLPAGAPMAPGAPMPAYAPGYGQAPYPQVPPQGMYYPAPPQQPPLNPDQPPPRPPKPGNYSAVSPVPQPQPMPQQQQQQPMPQQPQQQQQQQQPQQPTGLPPTESIYSDLYPILE